MGYRFKVLEGITERTTDVEFTISPSLSSVAGVTITNTGERYIVRIDKDTFTSTTDVTYTLTATIGTGTSAVTRNRQFTIEGKTVAVATLTIAGVGSTTSITTNGGTLQMSAMDGTTAVTSPTWSVTEADGTTATTKATISANGLLTAVANGTVK